MTKCGIQNCGMQGGLFNPFFGIKQPIHIDELFDDSFSGDLSNYDVNAGAGSISISGSTLRLSGGPGATTFTSYMTYNNPDSPNRVTMLEKWKQSVTFICPTVTSTTHGFSIGVRSTNNSIFKVDNVVRIQLSNVSSQLGRFHVSCINNGTVTTTSDGTASLIAGQTYTLEVERSKNLIICNLYDSTGVAVRSSFTRTWNISTSNINALAHNTGKFCLWNNGGNITITNWTVSSTASKNVDIVCVGDSNMSGYYAQQNSNRYCESTLTTLGKSFEILAGTVDGTLETLSYIDEIIFLNPDTVYINNLSNDVALGMDDATMKSNYISIINQLKAKNIRVIHGTPIARTGVNLSTITAWLISQFPNDTIVNLFAATKQAANNNLQAALTQDGGTHLNVAGNTACATILNSAL